MNVGRASFDRDLPSDRRNMTMNRHERIGTFLIGTVLASSIALPIHGKAASFEQNDARTYDDYDAKASWASAMRYFVSKRQINTYASHPKTGKQGHWLHPDGGLTEGQMLTTLTKSLYAKEYARTKPTKGVAYSVAYKVAAKHGLDTKATLTKGRDQATKTVTRGQYAKILASAFYKKKVSQDEAIFFMYEARITKGLKNKEGFYPRSYSSYGKSYKVDRGFGFEMLKTYQDYVIQATKPKPKIKVLYGKHDYGSLDQNEYDAVVKIAKKALIGVEDGPYAQSSITEKAYSDFLDGVKPINDRSNPNFRSDYNMSLLYAEENLAEFKNSGMTKNDIISFWQLRQVIGSVDTGEDPETGVPRSAYDALVLKTTDCDADAQVENLFLDMMGYNTAVLGRPGHAFPVVKLGGAWRNTATFRKVDINDYRNNVGGERVISAPTLGY